MNRKIKYIVLHCTAGAPQQKTENIKDYWRRVLGWRTVGYHKLVNVDGTIETLQPDNLPTNGVRGFNQTSIHICYKGGLNGIDTRTPKQKESLLKLVKEYKKKYPTAFVLGHRDLSPDLNKDGKITPNEWVKICPCFSAINEYSKI
jgi:N-acetyl-anhydromuramyl-L-alanine amidase AmpD